MKPGSYTMVRKEWPPDPSLPDIKNGAYTSDDFRIYSFKARKMQESGWKPRWFEKDTATDTYRYLGGYWESREKGSWEGCPDIFGQVPNDLIITD